MSRVTTKLFQPRSESRPNKSLAGPDSVFRNEDCMITSVVIGPNRRLADGIALQQAAKR